MKNSREMLEGRISRPLFLFSRLSVCLSVFPGHAEINSLAQLIHCAEIHHWEVDECGGGRGGR